MFSLFCCFLCIVVCFVLLFICSLGFGVLFLPKLLFCGVAALLTVPNLFQLVIWMGFLFYFVLSCCFLAVASTSNFVHNEQNRRKTNTIAKYVIIFCIFSMVFAHHL